MPKVTLLTAWVAVSIGGKEVAPRQFALCRVTKGVFDVHFTLDRSVTFGPVTATGVATIKVYGTQIGMDEIATLSDSLELTTGSNLKVDPSVKPPAPLPDMTGVHELTELKQMTPSEFLDQLKDKLGPFVEDGIIDDMMSDDAMDEPFDADDHEELISSSAAYKLLQGKVTTDAEAKVDFGDPQSAFQKLFGPKWGPADLEWIDIAHDDHDFGKLNKALKEMGWTLQELSVNGPKALCELSIVSNLSFDQTVTSEGMIPKMLKFKAHFDLIMAPGNSETLKASLMNLIHMNGGTTVMHMGKSVLKQSVWDDVEKAPLPQDLAAWPQHLTTSEKVVQTAKVFGLMVHTIDVNSNFDGVKVKLFPWKAANMKIDIELPHEALVSSQMAMMFHAMKYLIGKALGFL